MWLIVGAIAGWLAGLIVKGYGFGLIGNIVVGIVGAFIAGWLLPRLGLGLRGRYRRLRSSTPHRRRDPARDHRIGQESVGEATPDWIGDGCKRSRNATSPGFSGPMRAIRPRQESNALYRRNLSKGQTGLSIAFDLPTQTGYDSDHPLAAGEVGKVGVPISHIGDMRALLAGIPPGEMNTSMTINATAAWLLALYIANADEQNVPRTSLQGTTQNDIIKEYLSRGTYVFPPAPSMRLIKDTILFTTTEMPKWNPMNVCSYHLQEAGATPVQELSYALATAIAVLDTVKASGEVKPEDFGEVVGRISFFVNAGMRFITEMCKMRAFAELWDEIAAERYGVDRCQAAAVPLRRAGQFAGSHRAAAGKQRLPHPA